MSRDTRLPVSFVGFLILRAGLETTYPPVANFVSYPFNIFKIKIVLALPIYRAKYRAAGDAPLATIDASGTLIDAARKMVEKQVKRLVVTERDKIIGIVSQTDLVQSMTDFQKLAKMGLA